MTLTEKILTPEKLRYVFYLIFFLSSFMTEAKILRVLFLGNSYTNYNNLPLLVSQVATSMGDTLIFSFNTPGGYRLIDHYGDATSLSKIAQGNWDFVVLQAQSQEPSFPDEQVAMETIPYAQKLDSLIKTANPCTETLFYMTWGRKNGDASNCPIYPPLCTYEGMQSKLRERYLLMASICEASVVPVGVAWKKMRQLHPSTELYNADESHPSLTGSYLAALSFYQCLFLKAPSAQVYKAGLSDSTAEFIRTITSSIVSDSSNLWFQNGKRIQADFTYSVGAGSLVSFSATGFGNSEYEWNFGDGNFNTGKSLDHTYSANGIYQVKLKASNNCFADSITKTIFISGTTSIQNPLESFFRITPNPYRDKFRISGNTQFQVIPFMTDIFGKEIKLKKEGEFYFPETPVECGIYSLKILELNGRIRPISIIKTQ